jgi:MFS family permease
MTAPSTANQGTEASGLRGGRFAALSYRNFTLLWTSLLVSNAGTWMQNVALGWWAVHLPHPALTVGLLGASQAIPMLILPPLGGAVADRVNRLTLLKYTQTIMLVLAAVMAVLIGSGQAQLWQVLLINALSALALAFDNPTRQAFVPDLVDRPALMSAISLNSTAYQGAAAVGPAIAGALIPFIGVAGCLWANAISFLAVLGALFLMKVPHQRRADIKPVATELISGFRYVWNTKIVLVLLLIATITGLFGRSYSVLLPVFAKEVLHTGAAGFGGMQAMPGIGTFIGGFGLAAMGDVKRKGRLLLLSCLAFAALVVCFALARNYLLALLFLLAIGAMSTVFGATTQTILQVEVPQFLRGRVMSLNAVTVIGMSQFGGFVIGAAATQLGAPVAVAFGAIVVVAGTLTVYARNPLLRRYGVDQPSAVSRQPSAAATQPGRD